MFHLLAMAASMMGPTEDVAKAGSDAASTLTQTALGSLVVLLLIVCGLLGWLVVKGKNAHLADKDVMREEMLKQAIQSRELAGETSSAYEQLAEAARRSEQRSDRVLDEIEDLTKRMSSIGALSDGHCTDAQKASERICTETQKTSDRIDALAMSIPGLDRDKYFLATKGGGK
jgi:uncharacterized protein HemX